MGGRLRRFRILMGRISILRLGVTFLEKMTPNQQPLTPSPRKPERRILPARAGERLASNIAHAQYLDSPRPRGRECSKFTAHHTDWGTDWGTARDRIGWNPCGCWIRASLLAEADSAATYALP
jgi:hypothetical protein